MIVTTFGYLILISIDFKEFYLSVFSLGLVSIEKMQLFRQRLFHNNAHWYYG